MSVYLQILDIAQAQAEAAGSGDLDRAAALLETRRLLMEDAPAPSARDEKLIRDILRLDKDLATAFRRRMIAIREEASGTQRGHAALHGYRPTLRHTALTLDIAR
jgi:hypothetical protein